MALVARVKSVLRLKALHDQVHDLNRGLEQRVTDQIGEIERMSRLRRFLPPQVADLIVSSGRRAARKPPRARSPSCSATCAASPASPKAPSRKT